MKFSKAYHGRKYSAPIKEYRDYRGRKFKGIVMLEEKNFNGLLKRREEQLHSLEMRKNLISVLEKHGVYPKKREFAEWTIASLLNFERQIRENPDLTLGPRYKLQTIKQCRDDLKTIKEKARLLMEILQNLSKLSHCALCAAGWKENVGTVSIAEVDPFIVALIELQSCAEKAVSSNTNSNLAREMNSIKYRARQLEGCLAKRSNSVDFALFYEGWMGGKGMPLIIALNDLHACAEKTESTNFLDNEKDARAEMDFTGKKGEKYKKGEELPEGICVKNTPRKPKRVIVFRLTEFIQRHWREETGKEATTSTVAGVQGGPYLYFVQDIFKCLGLKENADHYVKKTLYTNTALNNNSTLKGGLKDSKKNPLDSIKWPGINEHVNGHNQGIKPK